MAHLCAFGGWGLTDAGRATDAARARELDGANACDDVQGAYDDFLGLNQRTLDICGAGRSGESRERWLRATTAAAPD